MASQCFDQTQPVNANRLPGEHEPMKAPVPKYMKVSMTYRYAPLVVRCARELVIGTRH